MGTRTAILSAAMHTLMIFAALTAAQTSPVHAPRPDVAPEAQPSLDRLYQGLTLAQWQQRIKSLDPDDPQTVTAVPGLIELVKHEAVPSFTRRQAALTLARLGEPGRDVIPVLVNLLAPKTAHDGDHQTIRFWVLKALTQFGPDAKQAAPRLLDHLYDPSQRLTDRMAVLEPLAQIGTAHPRVVPALIRTVQGQLELRPTEEDGSVADDQGVRLRASAAEALAVIGPPASSAVPALIRSTRDENELLRAKSVAALGAMGPRAEIAIPALGERLAFDESAGVRNAAGDALAAIGPDSLRILRPFLQQSEDSERRRRAAASLAQMGSAAKPAKPDLIAVLDDGDPRVRINAVEALWAVTEDPALVAPALVREFTTDDRHIQRRAFRLLTEIGPQARSAVAPLQKLLHHDQPTVRRLAAEALKKIKPEQ